MWDVLRCRAPPISFPSAAVTQDNLAQAQNIFKSVSKLTPKPCPTCGSLDITPLLRSTCTSFKVRSSALAFTEILGCSCENGHIFLLTRTDLQRKAV